MSGVGGATWLTESAIWLYDASSGILTPIWVNPDGSAFFPLLRFTLWVLILILIASHFLPKLNTSRVHKTAVDTIEVAHAALDNTDGQVNELYLIGGFPPDEPEDLVEPVVST